MTLLNLLVDKTGSFSCTTFCLKQKEALVYGRNFDFMIGLGHVLVNKRNVTKKSLVAPTDAQLEWTSRYGSISFNQLGREFPYGGMNEGGLVIEQLWLDRTTYPKADDRFPLSVLQWIQYQLDTAQSVEDVIASTSQIRIVDSSGANLHFFVADKHGGVAAIEFIDGDLVSYSDSQLVYPVLTNHSYEESVAHMNGSAGVNPDTQVFTGDSLGRFRKASEMVTQLPDNEDAIAYAFRILETVKQGDFTQWSIVYDVHHRAIYFKTHANQAVKKLYFNAFDFSSELPSMYTSIEGDTHFEPASYTTNSELVNSVFDSLGMLKDMPSEVREITVAYPDTTVFNGARS